MVRERRPWPPSAVATGKRCPVLKPHLITQSPYRERAVGERVHPYQKGKHHARPSTDKKRKKKTRNHTAVSREKQRATRQVAVSERAQPYQTAAPHSKRQGKLQQYRERAVNGKITAVPDPVASYPPLPRQKRERIPQYREQSVRQGRAKPRPRTQHESEKTAVSRESRDERAPPDQAPRHPTLDSTDNSESTYRRIG